jgi:hypothetical protein
MMGKKTTAVRKRNMLKPCHKAQSFVVGVTSCKTRIECKYTDTERACGSVERAHGGAEGARGSVEMAHSSANETHGSVERAHGGADEAHSSANETHGSVEGCMDHCSGIAGR